jgi:DNA-binding response OmpR family regulator
MTDKAHVLVVDDEAEVRDLLQEYLGRQEFEISTAESVPAARAALDAMAGVRAVGLVILDLKMPGENGLVLARELRDRGGVAVIMLTASGETIDWVVGLEIGADDDLAKPFDPRELLARIRSVLRRVGINRKLLRARGKGSKPRQLRAHPPGSASGAAGSIWMPGGCSRPMVPRCRSRPCSST